jgi:hypothetical protein
MWVFGLLIKVGLALVARWSSGDGPFNGLAPAFSAHARYLLQQREVCRSSEIRELWATFGAMPK